MIFIVRLKCTHTFSSVLMHKAYESIQNNPSALSFIELAQGIKTRKSYSTKTSPGSCFENNNLISNQSPDSENDFKDLLIKWAIQNNISQLSFSRLLKILSEYGIENLPKNSRELLKARAGRIKMSVVPPGVYTHFGFKTALKNLMESLISRKVFNQTEIGISIFIDNLPLVKFTQLGLWVILGSVEGFTKNVFFVGAYHGYSRPNNSNLFLSEFVEEAKNLCVDGLEIGNKNFDVKIKRLICDAPAKSFVLNIKDFTGYSSCTKCKTVGEYSGKKICFLEKSTLRTDKDYENDEMYRSCKTNLLQIPNFGVVSNVTLDYMHLVCLGVVQKLLSNWLSYKKHWSDENSVSELMKNLACVWPRELGAKPKSFKVLTRWSANEFRHFLLYLGPVVLKDNLKTDFYHHFLLLHVACRLLCTEASVENVDRGRKLLNDFIENYKKLYKTKGITHNIHGLYHLADECISHGTLDRFSAFPFEKFLLRLRNTMKRCRKRAIPPQILIQESYDKIFSQDLTELTSRDYKLCKKLKNSGGDRINNYSSYEELSLKNFDIIPKVNGDRYVLLKNNKVMEVVNILEIKEKSKKTHFIAGKEYTSIQNFYPEPFTAFPLNMFTVGNPSDVVDMWPIDMIDKKCMKVPIGEEKSVMIALMDENFQ